VIADARREDRRAHVVGLGLIGGSIAAALRAEGWTVTGSDRDPARTATALARGLISAVAPDGPIDLTVVATPLAHVAEEAARALAAGPGVVTDVAGVKAPVVAAVRDPRFVGGHPMAGSEQEGLDGADATMFVGATWVLTPQEDTDPEALALVHSMVSTLGADAVTLDAAVHDRLVAMVSHVPHLAAATLMSLASERALEHEVVLRLAAGGFRDMTRIASGHPGIWPDICAENRHAIVEVLDALTAELRVIRDSVATGDRQALLTRLETAREARVNLPVAGVRPERLVELRVPVSDRPGELASITALATELGVNIYDIEIAHSAEGPRGVVILVVDGGRSPALADALTARDYAVSVRELT
jgi:prephenate dehydrogenase